MTRVVLDKPMLSRIRQLNERAELCDDEGNTLGYFVPVSIATREQTEVPYTEAELKRAEEEPGGRPLATILAELESRP